MNISCKYGHNKGQKQYGPNRSRRQEGVARVFRTLWKFQSLVVITLETPQRKWAMQTHYLMSFDGKKDDVL